MSKHYNDYAALPTAKRITATADFRLDPDAYSVEYDLPGVKAHAYFACNSCGLRYVARYADPLAPPYACPRCSLQAAAPIAGMPVGW